MLPKYKSLLVRTTNFPYMVQVIIMLNAFEKARLSEKIAQHRLRQDIEWNKGFAGSAKVMHQRS